MSTIKADAIQSKTADTDLTISGNGTGVPNLETGTKLNDVALTGAATAALPLTVANGGTGITAVGSSGNVLTSNGSAWASTAPAGGGAWSYISGVNVTEVANIDFTGLNGDYEVYMFQFGGVMGVDFQPYLRWYFGTGAGPTWAATKHSYLIDKTVSGSTSYVQENTLSSWSGVFSAEAGPGTSASQAADNPYSYYGQMLLMGHANSDQHARVLFKGCGFHSSGNVIITNSIRVDDGVAYYGEVDNITGMRFFPQGQDWSSENSGTIKLYGLSPS